MEIGVWGDSISYGEFDSEGLGWVGRLRKKLLETASVYNRGVCGDTTEGLLKRFSAEADSIEPDLIVFAIGINDSKFPSGKDINLVPLDQYRANMNELISQARKYTNQIYLVGPTRVYEQRVSPTGSKFLNSEIQKYDDSIRELAEAEKLIFISTAEVLDVDTDLADGLHPNAEGYRKMFDTISFYIK